MDTTFAWVAQAADPKSEMEYRRYVNANETWMVAAGDSVIHVARNQRRHYAPGTGYDSVIHVARNMGLAPGCYYPESGRPNQDAKDTSFITATLKKVEVMVDNARTVEAPIELGLSPNPVKVEGKAYDRGLYARAVTYGQSTGVLKRSGEHLVIVFTNAIAIIAPVE
jgi:hypothetical protein